MRPRPACEVWTRKQWITLARHLHNNNPLDRWVMGFFGPNYQNKDQPEVQYRRAKKHSEQGIQWAWFSLCGKGVKKIAFTPYSQNAERRSRWGAVDFDAHGDGPECAENARRMAFAFFMAAINLEGVHVILEASGRGWHVWLIAKDFSSVEEWHGLIQSKLIEADIYEDIEVFPRPSDNDASFGYGMRAPGSWHPGKDTVNMIWWEDVGPLLNELVPLNIGKRESVPLKERKDILASPLSLEFGQGDKLVAKHGIREGGTRHNRLKTLVGVLFFYVGRERGRELAGRQYRSKTVPTQATEVEHLAEFDSLWAGLHRKWLLSLNEAESKTYGGLHEETEMDAFRIMKAFATLAAKNDAADFAIARDNIAGRLGITGRGAGKLIQRFMEANVIRRVREYVAHKFAARYVWHPAVVGLEVTL